MPSKVPVGLPGVDASGKEARDQEERSSSLLGFIYALGGGLVIFLAGLTCLIKRRLS